MTRNSERGGEKGGPGRFKAFFLQEVRLPESPFFRDALAICLLVGGAIIYHLQDVYLTSLPGNDLAGSIAWFEDYKRQWLAEGSLPLWLPTWFTGMLNLHSFSEFLLILPFSLVMTPIAAYRMVSLLVIGAGSAGVFRLLRQFGIDRDSAFIGGLVFFSHPLMVVESRFFGHMAFLMILAILPFYLVEVRYLVHRSRWWWPLVRASLLLGLVFSLHPTMGVMVSLMTLAVGPLLYRSGDTAITLTRAWVRIAAALVAAFALSAFASLPLWIESQANLALFAGGKSDGISRVVFPVPSPLFFFDRMGIILGGSEGTRAAMGETPLLIHYPVSSGGCYLGWSVFLLVLAGALVKTREKEGHRLFLLAPVWVFIAWLSLGNCSALESFGWLMKIGSSREAWAALLIGLALPIWALVFSRKGLKRADQSSSRKIILAGIFVAATIIFPGFPALQTMVPFFSKIRAPSQLLVPAFVILPVIVGSAVQEIRRRLRTYPRMVVTACVGILLVADFYPYNPASFMGVSGFAWPMLQKATAVLKEEQGRERVIYSEAYSPLMDYAISVMSGKNHFSYWLNWAAPRYTGAYRERVYGAWYHWLKTGDPEEWKALMAVANVHYIIIPCFQLLLPPEPALTKIYHNLLFDVYAFKEALGEWQVYPAHAIPCSDSDGWGQTLVTAFRQRCALVDGKESAALGESDRCTLSAQPPGKIVQAERPTSTRGWAEVDIVQPAILMWSESYHPYWRVQVDGKTARLLRVNHAFLGVRVPAGKHRVLFEFGPYPWKWIGAVVSLTSLAALLLAAYVISRKGQSRRR